MNRTEGKRIKENTFELDRAIGTPINKQENY